MTVVTTDTPLWKRPSQEQRAQLVQAAERGDSESQAFLAELLISGNWMVAHGYAVQFPQDIGQGLRWQLRAVRNGSEKVAIQWLYAQLWKSSGGIGTQAEPSVPEQATVSAFADIYEVVCAHHGSDENLETLRGLRQVAVSLSQNNPEAARQKLQAMGAYYNRNTRETP